MNLTWSFLIRQKFRRKIRSREWSCLFAENGVHALELLAETPDVDIIMTDINMPIMDGLTLLGRVQDQYPLLRTLVVSAYGDMQNIRTAMNRGAFDFVTKPIDFEDLETTIQKTWDTVRTLKQAVETEQSLDAIRKELDIARMIQTQFLPTTFPSFANTDLFAMSTPAREVGGDFYDFFFLDEHRLGFTIGDVSGKGVSAALFMAVTRTLIKALALQGLSPGACMTTTKPATAPGEPGSYVCNGILRCPQYSDRRTHLL